MPGTGAQIRRARRHNRLWAIRRDLKIMVYGRRVSDAGRQRGNRPCEANEHASEYGETHFTMQIGIAVRLFTVAF